MTYISILSSISIVIIVVLSTYTPLVAFPTFRIAFEGILIKLAGYLFGPFIGVSIGIITDLIITILRPSYIHWGYILAIALYGFLGGLCYLLKNRISKSINLLFFVIIILCFPITGLGIWSIVHIQTVNFLGFHLPKWLAIILIFISSMLTIIFIMGILIVFWFTKSLHNKIHEIIPIIFLCLLTEYIVSIGILPFADHQTLGIPYNLLLYGRLLSAPFQILFNVVFLYLVWKFLNSVSRVEKIEFKTNYNKNPK